MTNTDARQERLAQMSSIGLALSELAGQLRRAYSNYEFIEPDEEPIFEELWKGIIDIEHVLENSCHDMPPGASEHFTEVTGYVRIPTFSGDEIAANYDWRRYPWHYARRLRAYGPKHYLIKTFDGIVVGNAVKTLLSKPVKVPDGIQIDFEPRRPSSWLYVFEKDGIECGRWDTAEAQSFSSAPLELDKTKLVIAGDNGLAPEIPANSPLLLDETVLGYDGSGYYAFGKPNNRIDIAELKPAESGGFVYTSYKDRPEHLKDLSSLKFLGKFRYILERNREAEPKPRGDFSNLDED